MLVKVGPVCRLWYIVICVNDNRFYHFSLSCSLIIRSRFISLLIEHTVVLAIFVDNYLSYHHTGACDEDKICLCSGPFVLTSNYMHTHGRGVIIHPRSNLMMTSSDRNIFRVTGPLCGEFTGPSEFPTQKPETRSFDVFFDLRLNKRLSKQP